MPQLLVNEKQGLPWILGPCHDTLSFCVPQCVRRVSWNACEGAPFVHQVVEGALGEPEPFPAHKERSIRVEAFTPASFEPQKTLDRCPEVKGKINITLCSLFGNSGINDYFILALDVADVKGKRLSTPEPCCPYKL